MQYNPSAPRSPRSDMPATSRRLALVAGAGLMLLGACAQEVNPGSPMFWPFNVLTTASADPAEQQRRGAVELAVKTGFPSILDEIAAGTGPNLEAALNAARVPMTDRPARVLQLQGDLGLYNDNPGALVTSLLIYGSPAG